MELFHSMSHAGDPTSNYFISNCPVFLFFRQQWQNEKNGLEAQITELEKKLKGNEENSRKREKESKKVWMLKVNSEIE